MEKKAGKNGGLSGIESMMKRGCAVKRIFIAVRKKSQDPLPRGSLLKANRARNLIIQPLRRKQDPLPRRTSLLPCWNM
ncbi:TPA_asm: ALTO [Steenbok polyomavirus]|nr:TPA_asm: ALTO [Steenbok polyomavirus]